MEKLHGRNYILFVYHHIATTILHQLPSFVNLTKTHNNLKTYYNYYLLFILLVDLLWLLPTICSMYRFFGVVAYCLHRLLTICGCCLPSIMHLILCAYYLPFVTHVDLLWMLLIVYNICNLYHCC
jgi:hypothetical protein